MEITDINFILSHFEEPIFPRKMMTAVSNGQFSITSVDEIFEKCKQSDFKDCRINAYPDYTEYQGIVRYPPNFVFIDLDLDNFAKYKDPRKTLDRVLRNTLKKVSSIDRENLSTDTSYDLQHPQNLHHDIQPDDPTVLWTGKGYHIYIPVSAIILDHHEQFSKDKFPNLFSKQDGKYYSYSVSEVFLKFAKDYFTDGKADPQHRPKYKSCLIRIPSSFNSKCLSEGLSEEESKVKVIQKWNGYRLPIQLLTKYFLRWLVQEEITQRSIIRENKHFQGKNNGSTTNNFQIGWIERLLQKGIPDGRKEALRLILGPYLAKRESNDDAIIILQKWLDECNSIKPLDRNFNPKQRIISSLKNTRGFLILDNLKTKYRWLYDAINNSTMK